MADTLFNYRTTAFTSWTKVSETFTVSADGNYNVGFHAVSPKGIAYIAIDSFLIEQQMTTPPNGDITLSDTGTYVFAPANRHYGAQPPRTVTITNNGNQPTGALTIVLSDQFTVSKTAIPSLAANGTDSFTIAPKTGLAVGTHSATLTVSDSNGILKTLNISFTVNKPPSCSKIGCKHGA